MMETVGSALTIACTVTGDDTVDVKWKNTDGVDKTSLATQEAYVTGTSTRVSKLTIPKLILTESTTFTCYTEFGDSEKVEQTIQLHVVGWYYLFNAFAANKLFEQTAEFYYLII